MKPTSSRPPQTLAFAGVDGETGKGATDRIEEIARQARSQRIERVPLPQRPPPTRSSREGLLRERGFGLVLPKGIDPRIESALSPLCAHRRAQAGGLFRRLDYLPGEDHRAWLVRHLLSPGDLDPRKVPGFLLLVGPPSAIPFELQRSLGLSFAVGRLCFPAPEGYAEYANSVVAWETKDEQRCAREVICWGPRHEGDDSTGAMDENLWRPLLGVPGLRTVFDDNSYGCTKYLHERATKENLLRALRGDSAPAILLTASHGVTWAPGHPRRRTEQGALLTQDWPAELGAAGGDPNRVSEDHRVAGADIDESVRVRGTIALLFACFGAGTPAGEGAGTPAGQEASEPFLAALPQALLERGALGVLAPVDRALGRSLRPGDAKRALRTFHECLDGLMKEAPLGIAVEPLRRRCAELSNELADLLADPAADDREIAALSLERREAQSFVLLGDPSVRVACEPPPRPIPAARPAREAPPARTHGRALFCYAETDKQPPLRLLPELELIEAALTPTHQLQRRPCRDAGSLISILRAETAQVLHVSGHGSDGSLLAGDIEAELAPIAAGPLRSARLVFLNLCQSAVAARDLVLTAERLLPRIPCTIGVWGDIDDRAACQFSGLLYQGLARGESVACAFQWARVAISKREGERLQLFERWPGLAERIFLRGPFVEPVLLDEIEERLSASKVPVVVHYHAAFSPRSAAARDDLEDLARDTQGEASVVRVEQETSNDERALFDRGIVRFPRIELHLPGERTARRTWIGAVATGDLTEALTKAIGAP